MTVASCLEITAQLRQRGVQQPLLLMGYVNPLLAYGIVRYAQDAAAAGADGFIIPDLPPEEAGEMEAACRARGLALVYLLPPSATAERLALVSGRTGGFLYLVSLTGVTGARSSLPPDLAEFIRRARLVATTPLAVGFGISSAQQAAAVGELADGVIVGSALIQAVERAEEPLKAAAEFVKGLARGLVGAKGQK
jgi:tryptophan synthase alpha chain